MRRFLAGAGAVALVVLTSPHARAGALQPLRDGVPAVATDAGAAWTLDADPAAVAAPVSTSKAVLYSLLLPGLGDWQLGNRGRAAAFFAVEGAIWISYATFEVQGGQREDEYQSLAVQFAGVTRTGHSDEYYAELREYDNSEQYEAAVKLDGRIELATAGGLTAIGAEALEQYYTDHRVSDFEPWQWSSLDRRLQYSEVRSSSKTSYRRADYMLAAAAANRLVSAVFAFASARSVNRALAEPQTGYHLDFMPRASGVDVAMMVTRSF
jgi:hypothetical protein